MPLPSSSSTGVAITNPLVLYRALIATKRIDPDPAQHRLAIHLQKLYERLKDYEPITQYSHRLQQISRTLGRTPVQQNEAENEAAQRPGILSSLLGQKKERDSVALTRVLTSHEAALELDSPQGLMLHGEVGTGKSMLIDLFADCLPNRKKRRWHFTTFMLETFSKLEQLRRSRQMVVPTSLGLQDDYALMWLARDMISTSPILFLDEFQLPDRAASKIMSNLMTSFFHLGGVLIATSNRMPEELAKAAGMEFTPPPSRMESLGWRLGFARRHRAGKQGGLFSGENEFVGFLEVLRARCEVWEMDSKKDYRRLEAQPAQEEMDPGFEGLQNLSPGNIGLGFEQSVPTTAGDTGGASPTLTAPKNYFIKPLSAEPSKIEQWAQEHQLAQLTAALGEDYASGQEIPWSPGSMQVYGRNVHVPRQYNGVTSWTFSELCASTLGPADYISLAATYNTVILTDVPVLNVLQKNEARRFITVLDALYEARCKLLVTADAGPDAIFFPEMSTPSTPTNNDDSRPSKASREDEVTGDAVYPETFSEVYQDATAPFRPNVSMYDASTSEPDYTHARLSGLFNDDQLEDGPPNTVRRGDSIHGLDQDVVKKGLDFAQTSMFTGDDERFAYKRAKSRLWEMCGAKWWARNEEGWWTPVEKSVRHWENRVGDAVQVGADSARMRNVDARATAREGIGPSREIDEKQDEVLFRHGASPFRTHQKPPPKFSWTHAWGTMKWGKKAGAWGQGVEGLKDREKKKG